MDIIDKLADMTYLEPELQKLVDAGLSGTDILHGHLKNLIHEADIELAKARLKEEEDDYGDAMDSMERKYWEGLCEAYYGFYQLTYALSFAIAERAKKNG